jgi:hypothetical protein
MYCIIIIIIIIIIITIIITIIIRIISITLRGLVGGPTLLRDDEIHSLAYSVSLPRKQHECSIIFGFQPEIGTHVYKY